MDIRYLKSGLNAMVLTMERHLMQVRTKTKTFSTEVLKRKPFIKLYGTKEVRKEISSSSYDTISQNQQEYTFIMMK